MVRLLAVYAVLAMLGLAAWHIASAGSNVVQIFISSPREVLAYFSVQGRMLMRAFCVTGIEALFGLSLATGVALVGAFLVAIRPVVIRYILPPMITSQVVPLISIAPLLIVIFGIGILSKVIMASIISFFPIFIYTVVAIRDVPRGVGDMIDLYQPRRLFRASKIFLPLSLPALMAGLRVGSTLAVIGAIVAEFTGAEIGLGKNLFLATRRLQPDLMVCSIFLSVVLGAGLFGLIGIVERVAGKWYLS